MDKPILFSGKMVRAILDGRKTQTRRVVQFPRFWKQQDIKHSDLSACGFWLAGGDTWQYGDEPLPKPYLQGDRLWVRENGWERPERTPKMMREGADTWPPYMYDADNCDHAQLRAWGWRRRPSIHMPRWASRITLSVTGVRVERVQDISEGDAIAEGIEQKEPNHVVSAKYRYAQLWNSINAARGFGWDVNPWVWVITFKFETPIKE